MDAQSDYSRPDRRNPIFNGLVYAWQPRIWKLSPYWRDACSALIGSHCAVSCLGTPLAPLAFHPPHSANRHDAGCRGAGADRVDVANGLRWHVWTIKEMIAKAAEV